MSTPIRSWCDRMLDKHYANINPKVNECVKLSTAFKQVPLVRCNLIGKENVRCPNIYGRKISSKWVWIKSEMSIRRCVAELHMHKAMGSEGHSNLVCLTAKTSSNVRWRKEARQSIEWIERYWEAEVVTSETVSCFVKQATTGIFGMWRASLKRQVLTVKKVLHRQYGSQYARVQTKSLK
jgi:hypothetical protein